MVFNSEYTTVKAIHTRYYNVSLHKDAQDAYHITVENKLTHKVKMTSLIDYGMASFVFEAALNNFQGN